MANELVRVSLHAEMQKFGRKLDPRKPNIGTGLELTYAENRALFAVQKLLSETNYKGNTTPMQMGTFEVPGLKIKATKYLEAYGVKRYATKRGKLEYGGTERKFAMNALEQLSARKFPVEYDRIQWKKKKNESEGKRFKYELPLIELKKDGKGEYVIHPYPLLVDQIDTYFVWLPADLYEKVPAKDQTAILFIEYLLTQKELARRKKGKKPIMLAPETMARTLRLNTLIESRQWTRIRSQLDELYHLGRDLGYLSEFLVDQAGKKVDKLDILRLAA